MLIFVDLGFPCCLRALAAMINLKYVSFLHPARISRTFPDDHEQSGEMPATIQLTASITRPRRGDPSKVAAIFPSSTAATGGSSQIRPIGTSSLQGAGEPHDI